MPRRDWKEPRRKVDAEGFCRVCGGLYPQAAHIIPRSQVKPGPAEDPRNIVPLCQRCHSQQDQGAGLDILPFLSFEEQAYAVSLVGLESARRRITGER